ncbi:MAG TPA: hypothetical protein VF359_00240 [Anaerolineales bacterium]
MTWRLTLLLALLGLAAATSVAAYQPSPGYMDADYYYAGGLQLVNGHGFTESYLWNYLDDPSGLPHPSHAYWMPMASLLAAAGAALFGPSSWFAARAGFLLVAALIPPLTAALAWSFSSRRDLALISGLLAVFPAFYLPFLPVTDTFGLYILFGGLFFLVLNRKSSPLNPLLLGLLAGLMHLTRADGLLWLLIAILAVLIVWPKPSHHRFNYIFTFLLLTVAGYLLVMTPWFIRNYAAFGTPLAPGGLKLLWLTSYDQLFGYPASDITFSAWWQSGLLAIFRARVWALGLNLSNILSVQGEVILLPLIGLGLWQLRKDRRVQLAGLAWLGTLAAMTLVFPFAGARGGFFHSGASVQTVWWVLAPLGLDRFIGWGSRMRGWNIVRSGKIFQLGLVVVVTLLSAVIIYGRVMGGGGSQLWGREDIAYNHINTFMISEGMTDHSIVMVANPPGFYLASGNPAIAVPDGDLGTLLGVAHRYGAQYLILEKESTPGGLTPVYENPQGWAGLDYLGEVEAAHVFIVQP